MARDKDKLRRRLFGLYAANLTIHQPKHVDVFGCPVCLTTYSKLALDPPKGFDLGVDLAHCYPKASGGSQITLECRACNSRIGSQYDSHVAREHKIHDALGGKGTGAMPARLVFDGDKSIGINLSNVNGHWHMEGIERQSNPAHVAALPKFIGDPNAKFIATFDTYSAPHNVVSLIHAAYLLAFRTLGYEYPFFAETAFIRELLAHDNPSDNFGVPMIEITPAQYDVAMESMLHKVCFTLIDRRFTCISVCFPTPSPDIPVRMILLPAFGPLGHGHYQELRKMRPEKAEYRFESVQVSKDDPFERLSKVQEQGCGRINYARFVRACGVDISNFIQ